MTKEKEAFRVWAYSQSYRINGNGQLAERANSFFETAEVQGVSMDTVRAYAFALLALIRWLGGDWNKFEEFTQKSLQDWMAQLKGTGLKARTINHRLCAARVFYHYCFGKQIPHAPGVLYPRGHFRGSRGDPLRPARRVRRSYLELRVKVESKVMDPLKPQHIDLFLKNVRRYRDMGIALTMLLCGLRSQEVILLRMEDVSFHQSSLLIRGKGKRERMMPMPYRLMQLFEKYLEYERPATADKAFFVVLQGPSFGKPLSRAGVRRLFRYRSNKLGIAKLRPHQFRHAFASDMARSGVSISALQSMLGHGDLTSTQIYIELFLDDIRAEYDKAINRIEERYAALSKSPTA